MITLPSSTNDAELRQIAHQMVCLRNVLTLLSDNTKPTNEIFTSFVHLIPEAWQYPEITCVRLSFREEEFTTINFQQTKWCLKSDIAVSGVSIGLLEICYLEERPHLSDGPFLKQEHDMIETLVRELVRYIERSELLKSQERQHRELLLYSSLLRHDLKNNLGVILGNVDLARMILSNANNDIEEIIHSTESVCNRMIDLLQAFGRSTDEANQNLYELIKNVSSNAQKIHSGLTIDVNADKKYSSYIIPKSNLLPLVFENLLRNAAFHTNKNCIVKIELKQSDGVAIVRVADDGPGVSSEIQPRLFQKGVSTRGGGLGLYLSRQVIESMQGSIELVESKSGEGAVFEIQIPLAMIKERRV